LIVAQIYKPKITDSKQTRLNSTEIVQMIIILNS
jgi:hypothetical protein